MASGDRPSSRESNAAATGLTAQLPSPSSSQISYSSVALNGHGRPKSQQELSLSSSDQNPFRYDTELMLALFKDVSPFLPDYCVFIFFLGVILMLFVVVVFLGEYAHRFRSAWGHHKPTLSAFHGECTINSRRKICNVFSFGRHWSGLHVHFALVYVHLLQLTYIYLIDPFVIHVES